MNARLLVSVVCTGLIVAGCTFVTNDRPSTDTTATNTATSASAKPATPAPVRPVCVDVADKANEFLSQVVRLANGDSTPQRVRAAAAGLSDSVDDAKAAVGPDAAAELDEAGQVLGRARDVLATRPVDTAGLRTAANDLLTSLGDAAAVCTPDAASSTEDPADPGTDRTRKPTADLPTPTLDPTY
jgi:hypothetical protein